MGFRIVSHSENGSAAVSTETTDDEFEIEQDGTSMTATVTGNGRVYQSGGSQIIIGDQVIEG